MNAFTFVWMTHEDTTPRSLLVNDYRDRDAIEFFEGQYKVSALRGVTLFANGTLIGYRDAAGEWHIFGE